MLNVELLFQIAGIGIIVAILQAVLEQAGRDEMAYLTTLVGVAVVLFLVVQVLNDLFDAIRTLFPL